jgi:hypothetical protein
MKLERNGEADLVLYFTLAAAPRSDLGNLVSDLVGSRAEAVPSLMRLHSRGALHAALSSYVH